MRPTWGVSDAVSVRPCAASAFAAPSGYCALMATEIATLSPTSRRRIADVFARLDYAALGKVYCDEGGDAFWRAKRAPCERLGSQIAAALLKRLRRGGRSLYGGAGVAEIPALVAETVDLDREVKAYNLRKPEVLVLNRACRAAGLAFRHQDARAARGRFDHLWLVSVLNDPECYPILSGLAYGRRHPAALDLRELAREHRTVRSLVSRCLSKLSLPALVTTTAEEAQWIAEECGRRGWRCVAERKCYPTALVGDPVCFLHVD